MPYIKDSKGSSGRQSFSTRAWGPPIPTNLILLSQERSCRVGPSISVNLAAGHKPQILAAHCSQARGQRRQTLAWDLYLLSSDGGYQDSGIDQSNKWNTDVFASCFARIQIHLKSISRYRDKIKIIYQKRFIR